jgi:hypothetical protein
LYGVNQVQVTITSEASYLLIITFNNGETLHLSPGETSKPVDHLQINGNAKIGKLAQSGLITIKTVDVEENTAATRPQRERRERE